MYFDYAEVVKLMKLPMKPAQRKQNNNIRLAISAALDELSMRLRSTSFITSYSTSLAVATRETTLRGENEDLRFIYALKIGSGSYERVLEHVEPGEFLRSYDDADESAGYAGKWTQIKSSDGYPTIRFNKPLSVAETLVTYYWTDMTPDNIAVGRSISAVAAGGLKYFFGAHTPEGAVYDAQFRQLAALARSSDEFTPNVQRPMPLPADLRLIRNTLATLSVRRR